VKIFLHDKGILCTGKAWQIRQLLKQYQKNYKYVIEWVEDGKTQQKECPSSKNDTFRS
jgi:hypothetical protein